MSTDEFSLDDIKSSAHLIQNLKEGQQRKFIFHWVYLKCINRRIRKECLTNGLIVDWVNEAKKLFMTEKTRFYNANLSQAWIDKFKLKYNVTGDHLNLQLRYESNGENSSVASGSPVVSGSPEKDKRVSASINRATPKNSNSDPGTRQFPSKKQACKDKTIKTKPTRTLNEHYRAFLNKKKFVERLRERWSSERPSSFTGNVIVPDGVDADVEADSNFMEKIFEGFCVSYLKTNVCRERKEKRSCFYDHNINYHQDKSPAILKAIILSAIDEEFYSFVYEMVLLSVGKFDENLIEEIHRQVNWKFPDTESRKQKLLDLLFDEFRKKSQHLDAMVSDYNYFNC